jgi:ribosomal protein L11
MKHIYGAIAQPAALDAPAVSGTVRFLLRGASARASESVVRANLSVWGIDLNDFMDTFDAHTKHCAGAIGTVTLWIYEDKSWEFDFVRSSRVKPPLKPHELADPFRHS